MYLFKHAYPAAKEFLQKDVDFHAGVAELIDRCRADFASPFWDELATFDFDSERQTFEKWWPRSGHPDSLPSQVEVVYLALEDVPYGFDLEGYGLWSCDPDNWQWRTPDVYFGPHFVSEIMDLAFERAELCDLAHPPTQKRAKDTAESAYEVVEMFFALGYYGLLLREVIRNVDPAHLLGDMAERWFTIGHPDSEYGIIMGRLTRSGWRTFHG